MNVLIDFKNLLEKRVRDAEATGRRRSQLGAVRERTTADLAGVEASGVGAALAEGMG